MMNPFMIFEGKKVLSLKEIALHFFVKERVWKQYNCRGLSTTTKIISNVIPRFQKMSSKQNYLLGIMHLSKVLRTGHGSFRKFKEVR